MVDMSFIQHITNEEEMRGYMARAMALIAGSIVAAILVLLVTGKRVLVSEYHVAQGDTFFVEGWGNVGGGSQDSLVCRYFTGRSITTRVLWYSPANIFGRDQCLFIDSE